MLEAELALLMAHKYGYVLVSVWVRNQNDAPMAAGLSLFLMRQMCNKQNVLSLDNQLRARNDRSDENSSLSAVHD